MIANPALGTVVGTRTIKDIKEGKAQGMAMGMPVGMSAGGPVAARTGEAVKADPKPPATPAVAAPTPAPPVVDPPKATVEPAVAEAPAVATPAAPAAEPAKPAVAAAAPAAASTPPRDTPQDKEKLAKAQFQLAKSYLDSGLAPKAKAIFTQIIAKYPGTAAAAEAEELLKK